MGCDDAQWEFGASHWGRKFETYNFTIKVLETWKRHTQRHERYISTALPRNGVMLASVWILCTTWRAVQSGEDMLKVVGLMLRGSASTVGSNKIQPTVQLSLEAMVYAPRDKS